MKSGSEATLGKGLSKVEMGFLRIALGVQSPAAGSRCRLRVVNVRLGRILTEMSRYINSVEPTFPEAKRPSTGRQCCLSLRAPASPSKSLHSTQRERERESEREGGMSCKPFRQC